MGVLSWSRWSAGYTLLLADTQEPDQLEREALERALPTVDGIVLASSRMSDSAIRMIAKQKVLPVRLVVRGSTAQRSRKRTSPAWGTTKVSGSASKAARSTVAGSR